MLRAMFDQPKREDSGLLLATNEAITQYCDMVRSYCRTHSEDCYKYYRMEIWAGGFIAALNELEQSKYGSDQYAKQIRKSLEGEMDAEELNQYRLHVYFYKNAFIRVFSTLDKMGHFLNELFELQTGKVSSRFSYFTVLRQMHKKRIHTELEQKLFDLKEKYKLPLQNLRVKRNFEIHSINVEMIDDLRRSHHSFHDSMMIENITDNSADLEQSYEMVCYSLQAVFHYCTRLIKQ